jgi:hypothetical protein
MGRQCVHDNAPRRLSTDLAKVYINFCSEVDAEKKKTEKLYVYEHIFCFSLYVLMYFWGRKMSKFFAFLEGENRIKSIACRGGCK